MQDEGMGNGARQKGLHAGPRLPMSLVQCRTRPGPYCEQRFSNDDAKASSIDAVDVMDVFIIALVPDAAVHLLSTNCLDWIDIILSTTKITPCRWCCVAGAVHGA
eukprot:scaffold2486_cov92-Skeletonema_marinoi.AAC.1